MHGKGRVKQKKWLRQSRELEGFKTSSKCWFQIIKKKYANALHPNKARSEKKWNTFFQNKKPSYTRLAPLTHNMYNILSIFPKRI